MAVRFPFLVLLAGALAGCASGDGSSGTPQQTVEATAGAGQTGLAGVALNQPLVVTVKDLSGVPVAGKTVAWAAVSGGGTLVPASSVTSAAGQATTTFVLGLVVGQQAASATVTGTPPVAFSATASEAPAVTLQLVSGAGQLTAFGSTTAKPIVVRVNDVTGAPAPGRLVRWTTTGATVPAPAVSITGADGTAATLVTIGSAYNNSVIATTPGADSVAAGIAAFAPPLKLEFLTPSGPTVTCLGVHKEVIAGLVDSNSQFVGSPTIRFTAGVAGDQMVFDSILTMSGGFARDTIVIGTLVGSHTIMAQINGLPTTATAVYTTQSPCPLSFNAYPEGSTTISQGTTVQLNAVVQNDSGDQPSHLVTWSILSGGGSVSPSVSPGAGPDEGTFFTAGPASGQQVVRASTPGANPVDLTFNVLAAAPILVATVPAPGATYYHDTFVRDGLAFSFEWNEGVFIYDVGNGMKGGSPSNPQVISQLITSANGLPSAAVHNGWWFQNPVTGEKKYLFIGQEGPSTIGSASSGDIHIVDVSDLAHPREVGFIHVPGAGTHNFWMDEANQTLYAAYYNGGVIKVDVSGTLAGDMSSRIVAQVKPGGAGQTFVWGVMLANGTLYASDMLSGFWALDPATLATKSGGNNSPADGGSGLMDDLWIVDQVGYTGHWGSRSGAYLDVWTLGANGAPTLANSILVADAATVSDVAVSPDGTMLVATVEGGPGGGLYVWDRVDPVHPVLRGVYPVIEGLHTGEVKVVNGRTYVFAARDPDPPALMIFDITNIVH